VIDRSASMGPHGALAVAQRELIASLEQLPHDAWFQVILYNRMAEPLRLGRECDLLAATPENKRQVAAAVHSVEAAGGTEHLRALERALLFRPEVIFFLTDADDLTAEEVRKVTRLNQGRTAINAVELSDTAHHNDANALYLLAHLNRGVYRAENAGR
jgi:Ca-activated chloride channel family protein